MRLVGFGFSSIWFGRGLPCAVKGFMHLINLIVAGVGLTLKFKVLHLVCGLWRINMFSLTGRFSMPNSPLVHISASPTQIYVTHTWILVMEMTRCWHTSMQNLKQPRI